MSQLYVHAQRPRGTGGARSQRAGAMLVAPSTAAVGPGPTTHEARSQRARLDTVATRSQISAPSFLFSAAPAPSSFSASPSLPSFLSPAASPRLAGFTFLLLALLAGLSLLFVTDLTLFLLAFLAGFTLFLLALLPSLTSLVLTLLILSHLLTLLIILTRLARETPAELDRLLHERLRLPHRVAVVLELLLRDLRRDCLHDRVELGLRGVGVCGAFFGLAGLGITGLPGVGLPGRPAFLGAGPSSAGEEAASTSATAQTIYTEKACIEFAPLRPGLLQSSAMHRLGKEGRERTRRARRCRPWGLRPCRPRLWCLRRLSAPLLPSAPLASPAPAVSASPALPSPAFRARCICRWVGCHGQWSSSRRCDGTVQRRSRRGGFSGSDPGIHRLTKRPPVSTPSRRSRRNGNAIFIVY
ncbi:hypothetical protein MIND_00398500 [Mycena indigotica]|uniref:Uncharacterized protein n=1 Tax=Mycena indigotica TaxID=2126181 RepID=A0A8H6WA06_9AGAR|nr:uncharacterized protein MIND_00398500 [Mycena indigotica]KAF7310247.1 hypothetical protein MIND_00398500 [Mycena indigotica]